jgi:hypothetical protein
MGKSSQIGGWEVDWIDWGSDSGFGQGVRAAWIDGMRHRGMADCADGWTDCLRILRGTVYGSFFWLLVGLIDLL